MGFEYEVENSKIQIETRQIERGIAVMPLVLITTCLMYRNRFLVTSLDGWRARQCNRYRSSPRVFRTVYDNFHLDRERRVLELSYRFCRPTMSPKNGDFEFSWISRRVRVAFWNCLGLHLHYCATVSDSFQFSCPNMQWLARLDFKNLYPLFGWPSSYLENVDRWKRCF